MTTLLKQAAQLRKILHDMEVELGIVQLSAPEKSVLFAIEEISARSAGAEMNQIVDHPFVGEISRPTIFRAVAGLKSAGLIIKERGRRGVYQPNKIGFTL